MTTFTEKNTRRRTYYTGNGQERAARRARRAYKGTFGNSPTEVWNDMIQGTSGEERRGTSNAS